MAQDTDLDELYENPAAETHSPSKGSSTSKEAPSKTTPIPRASQASELQDEPESSDIEFPDRFTTPPVVLPPKTSKPKVKAEPDVDELPIPRISVGESQYPNFNLQ